MQLQFKYILLDMPVTSANIGGEVRLYDSFVSTTLAPSLKAQSTKSGRLMIIEMPVQQQVNHADCGLFSIAFAYHLALGDEPSALHFDNTKFRQHLIQCFQNEELSPFPVIQGQPPINCCVKKHRNIRY